MAYIAFNPKYHKFIKTQMLATAAISLLSSGVIFLVGGPLPVELGFLGLASAVIYAVYFLLFDRLASKGYELSNTVIGLFGVLILSLAVHFTGGLVSPFVFMYFFMLVSEALYGLDKTYTLSAILPAYLTVVFGQYSGLLRHSNPWAAELYTSLAATAFVAGITVMYLAVTRFMTDRIITTLHLKLSRELEEKDALVRKFSELNSTSQIGVLAHRIAHDLRGPIASISGYLELQSLKARSPEEQADLASVNATVDAMVESLHGITRFGKPGGPSVERIALPEFLRDLLTIASFAPQARWVKFKPLFKAEPPAATVASRADLQQAFFNVIKNAVEAVSDNPDAKTVELDLAASGKETIVSISDNGPGMPPEILANVFRKSVTGKKGGTGVGLIIARDLLVRNGGDIKLRNRDGGGLTVDVFLRAA